MSSLDGATKVYVGNMIEGVQEDEVRDLFMQFARKGRLADVWIARNPAGFAYVHYDSLDDAEDAIDECDGKEVEWSKGALKVEMSKKKSARTGDRRERSRGRGDMPPPTRYGGGGSAEVCRDFQNGRCTRGDGCRFEHVEGGGGRSDSRRRAPARGGGGREACRDFQAGRCTRGDGCRFEHLGGGGGRSDSRGRGGGRGDSPPPTRRDRSERGPPKFMQRSRGRSNSSSRSRGRH